MSTNGEIQNGSASGQVDPSHSALRTPHSSVESLRRDSAGQLVVRLRGQSEDIADVRLARCFPWSLPDEYISIRNKEGKEVALLRSLSELDDASRALAARELQDKVFNPKILTITDYKNEFGVISVTAGTDRGPATFQIRSRDDIRLLSPTRALFRDVDGNTYELPDIDALDPASRRRLQEYF